MTPVRSPRASTAFGCSVDMNPRFLRWLLLVVNAGPVGLSIAQRHTLGENGTLQFRDRQRVSPPTT
jgi:hypothetical protein